jgi:hypothetical protein
MLSLDRRIDAEVLDAHGGLAVHSSGVRLQAVLREVPELFVEGAQLKLIFDVAGDRFEALCRVVTDDVLSCEKGARLTLEVLRAAPAGISSIEAFDLVPLTPPSGVARPVSIPAVSLPPQAAFAADDEPREDDEPTGVMGTLREMPVSEIVQSLAQSHKDALVDVRPKGSESGVIGVERGRVVYAHTDTRTGEAAFFELFRATRGAFRIRYGRTPPARNIERDTTFLLLEGARVLDEQTELATSGKQVRPAEVLLPDSEAMPVHMPAQTSGLFSRFFDEAGVQTPAPLPLPQETQRFHSLQVPDIDELDDVDAIDTDRTARERKRPGAQLSDTPA